MTTSNTEFIFADGNYKLNKNITFGHLSKITLKLCKNCCKLAMINCMEGVGFRFEYIDGLEIAGLTLHRYSRMHSNMEPPSNDTAIAGLLLIFVSNLTMSEVTVEHSLGYGAFISMLNGHSTIEHSHFQYNHGKEKKGGNAVLHYEQCKDTDSSFTQVEINHSRFLFGESMNFYNRARNILEVLRNKCDIEECHT